MSFERFADRIILRALSRRPDFIIGATHDPYMLRWWLTPWSGKYRDVKDEDKTLLQRFVSLLPGVYLHYIVRSDDDRALHDHPWSNVSVLLRGSYVEHTIAAGGVHHRTRREAGSIVFRRATAAHRIELDAGPCWSLFITGVRIRHWGFHCPNGWVRLVSAYMVKYYREGGQWAGCDEPAHTIPTKGRMGLVQVVKVAADTIAPDLRARAKACADFLHEHLPEHFPARAAMVLIGDYVLADITLRMLVPRELARAQGFPDSYIIDRGLFTNAAGEDEWRPITKTDQVRLIGNSVCSQVAEALARANLADLIRYYAEVAIA